jgi:twinkle protein
MGIIIKKNLPCLSCKSSDARALYEDGSSHCFSCKTTFKKDEEFEKEDTKPKKGKRTAEEEAELIKKVATHPPRAIIERGISKAVTDFFGVKVSYNSDGKIDTHYYPYSDNTAYKVRHVKDKHFEWLGKSSNLFGIEKFNSGGKRLVICEGEIDALSVAQASFDKYKGKIYPVVALSSSAMTKSLLENRDYIRSFNEVVICFDEDDAGRKVRDEAIKIIGIDKVKLCKLPENDANDVMMKHDSHALMLCIFDAAPYIPSGIITKEALWDALVEYNSVQSIPYPAFMQGINGKAKGSRLGEIALFVAGTSLGKSTIMREIMYNFKQNTDEKLGIISLEESPAETARKMAGLALSKNPAEFEMTLDELRPGFDDVFGDDRIMVLDHQGSIKDESMIDKLEYMALSGVTRFAIDHITMLVSEGTDNLTGNEAIDKVMNDLLRFVKRYNVWIGLVSHLRKVGAGGKSFEEGRMPSLDDIKGSGSIKQVSFDIFAFARNLMEPDLRLRNTIEMAALKCRFTGQTGMAGAAYYNQTTGRFETIDNDFVEI